jgi:hypothetical protein
MIRRVDRQLRIVAKLGEGGMGAVFLGEHQHIARKAAIKVLLPGALGPTSRSSPVSSTRRAPTSLIPPSRASSTSSTATSCPTATRTS